MTWNIERPVNLVFGVAAFVLLCLSGMSYLDFREAEAVSKSRVEADEALKSLNSLLIDIQDAETGQRGFLLTGSQIYLEPYTKGTSLAREIMAKLKSSEGLADKGELPGLETAVEAKLSELKETIDLRLGPDGMAAALRVVNTDRGKNEMDQIRNKIHGLLESNSGQLQRRDTDLLNHEKGAFRLTLAASLASIAIIAIFVANIHGELRAKRQARLLAENVATELKAKNTELENALKHVKTLRGLLPLCSSCKKVRNDKGYWNQVEVFIRDNSEAQITHGICPDCALEVMRTLNPSTSIIRILLLEDNALDAELIEEALKRSGMKFECRRVATKEAFSQSLDFPEVILSDWSLPKFSGNEALNLLQERNIPVPFIIVSGNIGEVAAVEALRQGATDYVLKDRLSRLGEAVQRAINENRVLEERNRIEKELKASEEKLYRITQSVPVGIFCIDTSGRIQFVNDQWCQIAGISRESALGKTWLSTVHKEDRERVAAQWKTAFNRCSRFTVTFKGSEQSGNSKMLIRASYEGNTEGHAAEFVGALLKLNENEAV